MTIIRIVLHLPCVNLSAAVAVPLRYGQSVTLADVKSRSDLKNLRHTLTRSFTRVAHNIILSLIKYPLSSNQPTGSASHLFFACRLSFHRRHRSTVYPGTRPPSRPHPMGWTKRGREEGEATSSFYRCTGAMMPKTLLSVPSIFCPSPSLRLKSQKSIAIDKSCSRLPSHLTALPLPLGPRASWTDMVAVVSEMIIFPFFSIVVIFNGLRF